MAWFDAVSGAGSAASGIGGLIGGIGSLFKGNSQTPAEWTNRMASMPASFWRTASPEQIAMQKQLMADASTDYTNSRGAGNPFAMFRNALPSTPRSPAAGVADTAQRYAAMYAAKAGNAPASATPMYASMPGTVGNPGTATLPATPPKFQDYRGMGSPSLAQQMNAYFANRG